MVLDTVCWLCHKFSFGIEVEIGLLVERSFLQQSLDVCHAWQFHAIGESLTGVPFLVMFTRSFTAML